MNLRFQSSAKTWEISKIKIFSFKINICYFFHWMFQHTLIDTNTVMDLRKAVIDDIMPLTSPRLNK